MKNLLLLITLFFFSCSQVDTAMENEVKELKEKIIAMEKAAATPIQDETGFIHTVFFWMNENITEEQKANFAKNGLGELVKVSSIYKSYFGPPAKTPREVVDNSYDFALICHFKNKEDQDAYQIDPIHLKFIEDFKDLWKSVIVYDNLMME
ncbi:MAG: Dabb family protein [Saprospiraceae bacterium]